MMTIKTIDNPLVQDGVENKYCFYSNIYKTVDEDDIAKQMAKYNSSFTYADNIGILKVLYQVVTDNLAEGNEVKLPFCSIYPSACGTCSNLSEGFTPGKGDNKIRYKVQMTKQAKSDIELNFEYKQVDPVKTGNPVIIQVFKLNDDASEAEIFKFAKNETMRIKGRKLSFDLSDTAQGVFFIDSTQKEYRITRYSRCGTSVLDFPVPDSLPEGTYSVKIVTKPGVSRYSSAMVDEQITVESTR